MSATPLPMVQVGMHWFPQTAGGVDRYFAGLTAALRRAGVPFHALTLGHGEPPFPDVQFVAAADAPAWRRLAAFRTALPAGAPLIASHFALYALPLLDRLARTPHVVHFHGPWADESLLENQSAGRPAIKRAVERLVYATGNRFLVLSEAFKELLVARYRVPASRIFVVPGGIDLEPFSEGKSRAEARAHLGWPADRPIVLCVRRLARRMGLAALIEAIAALAKDFPDLLVLIAGRGGLSAELEAQIQRLGLARQVRLLGFVPDADLATAYAAADLTILPSQALEGFGLAALESLAAGTPALVTPVGGLPESVGSLDSRLVLSGTAAEHLAAGIATALRQPELLPSADACRRHAAQFSWPQVAPKILAHYAEVLAG